VRKAFYLAKLENRPIMLSCPMDIQQKNFPDDEPYKPSSEFFARGAVHPTRRRCSAQPMSSPAPRSR
jgi:hypothetical protein